MTDKPVMQVIPVEDLDRIEKLLDVFMNTIDMPHLAAIRQACMDEVVQYNNTLAEAQGAALEKFNKEMADWQAAEAKKKADEEAKAKKEAEAKASKEDYAKERTYA